MFWFDAVQCSFLRTGVLLNSHCNPLFNLLLILIPGRRSSHVMSCSATQSRIIPSLSPLNSHCHFRRSGCEIALPCGDNICLFATEWMSEHQTSSFTLLQSGISTAASIFFLGLLNWHPDLTSRFVWYCKFYLMPAKNRWVQWQQQKKKLRWEPKL